MTGYDLSRMWFNFCFDNPDMVKPTHTALYFFCIEHCNRLGWKEKFSFPTEMAKEAVGIKSYNTYINTLNDLVSWGFIKMIQKSSNQYSANIIAISKNNKATNKALDNAMIKHMSKQSESNVQITGESIDSINKHTTLNKEPLPDNPIGLFDSNESDVEKLSYKDVEKTKLGICNFLKTRPTDILPYIDYWNIFATENGKSVIKSLSEKRKLKLKSRIRESAFNINEILIKAKGSELLMTSKWFALDWIIANDNNYLKVIEGNYDNSQTVTNPFNSSVNNSTGAPPLKSPEQILAERKAKQDARIFKKTH